MSRLFDRVPRVPAEVLDRAALARREKALAHTTTDDGTWLLGTRDALVIVPPTGPLVRITWECVEAADWDREAARLRVSEVGEFGRPRPVHVFAIPDPGALLPMVRERVSASVVLQRRVVVTARSGLRVVARRAPSGRGATTWSYELDPGVDPDDPEVQRAAAAALRAAEEELGEGYQAR